MGKRKFNCADQATYRLFKKKKFTKILTSDRVQVMASALWARLRDIKNGNLISKPMKDWNVAEREAYVEEMIHYSSISTVDDSGDIGNIIGFMSSVSTYLTEGGDPEMMMLLDPVYLYLDWTNTNDSPVAQADWPVPLPLRTTIVPVANLSHMYTVNSDVDGHYVLGILSNHYAGLHGTTMMNQVPVVVRLSALTETRVGVRWNFFHVFLITIGLKYTNLLILLHNYHTDVFFPR